MVKEGLMTSARRVVGGQEEAFQVGKTAWAKGLRQDGHDQGTERMLVWLMQHEQRGVWHEMLNNLFTWPKGGNQNPTARVCKLCVAGQIQPAS